MRLCLSAQRRWVAPCFCCSGECWCCGTVSHLQETAQVVWVVMFILSTLYIFWWDGECTVVAKHLVMVCGRCVAVFLSLVGVCAMTSCLAFSEAKVTCCTWPGLYASLHPHPHLTTTVTSEHGLGPGPPAARLPAGAPHVQAPLGVLRGHRDGLPAAVPVDVPAGAHRLPSPCACVPCPLCATSPPNCLHRMPLRPCFRQPLHPQS